MKHCPGRAIDASYTRWRIQAIPRLPSVIVSFSTGEIPSERSVRFSKEHRGDDGEPEVAPHPDWAQNWMHPHFKLWI